MNVYVPVTWLVANLLHPFFFLIYLNDGEFYFSSDEISLLLLVFLYSLIFSLPSLLLAFLAEYLLLRWQVTLPVRYLVWLLTAPLIVLLNLAIVSFLFGGGLSFADFGIAFPAMVAVFITVLIRYKAFYKTYNKLNVSADEPGATV